MLKYNYRVLKRSFDCLIFTVSKHTHTLDWRRFPVNNSWYTYLLVLRGNVKGVERVKDFSSNRNVYMCNKRVRSPPDRLRIWTSQNMRDKTYLFFWHLWPYNLLDSTFFWVFMIISHISIIWNRPTTLLH